jgi:hypothetical protein
MYYACMHVCVPVVQRLIGWTNITLNRIQGFIHNQFLWMNENICLKMGTLYMGAKTRIGGFLGNIRKNFDWLAIMFTDCISKEMSMGAIFRK